MRIERETCAARAKERREEGRTWEDKGGIKLKAECVLLRTPFLTNPITTSGMPQTNPITTSGTPHILTW
jgi:hypothetical protein